MIRKVLFLGLFFALIFPSLPTSAQAKGIGITPAIDELILEEGQSEAILEVGIVNATDTEAVLRISTLDFGALNESGGIAFLGRTGQETTPYGLSKWMRPEKETIRLSAGQSETVRVVVTNADDLSPGGHYGAVIVSAVTEDRPDGDAVAVQPAASTLVLLKKRGGESYRLERESQKTNSSLIRLPKSTEILFKNTGNIHIVPRGTVELVSPFGSVVARGTVNEQSSYVLPDSNRRMIVDLVGQSGSWLPGKYTLRTTWRYDGTEETQIVEQSIWYVGKVLLWLVALMSTVIVLVMYVKYRKRPPTRY